MSVTLAKQSLKIRRSSILNKNVSILSSSIIKRPFTQTDYINNHIPTTLLNFLEDDKQYVVGFSNDVFLNRLKKHMLHPYPVSRLAINELLLHISKSDSLLIITNGSKPTYHALLIDSKDLHSLEEYIPISIHKLKF